MPIKVACQCGQRFAIKDAFAGKVIKCPKCGKPLRVPKPKATSDGAESRQSTEPRKPDSGLASLLEEAGMQKGVIRCPGCGKPLSEDAVLCVNCGYDLRKGHRIKARTGAEAEIDEDEMAELPVHGNPLLDKAERELAYAKEEQKRLGSGAPWWAILLALLGVIGFAAGMMSLPPDRVLVTSGWILVVVGCLIAAFATLRIWMIAGEESVLQVLLCVLVPPYLLFFIITRWNQCAGLFFMNFGGGVMSGAGLGLVFLSHVLAANKANSPTTGYYLNASPPAIVLALESTDSYPECDGRSRV